MTEVVERVKTKYREVAGAAVSKATEEARLSREGHRQIELRVRGRARRVARILGTSIYWLTSVLIFFAIALSFSGILSQLAWVGWGLAFLFAILTLSNLIKGWFLEELKYKLEEALRIRLEAWLLGEVRTPN